MREVTYTLHNNEFVKDGDKLILIDPKPLMAKTEYIVKLEYGEWMIKYYGDYPSSYRLKTYENELKLKP